MNEHKDIYAEETKRKERRELFKEMAVRYSGERALFLIAEQCEGILAAADKFEKGEEV